jgi:hypothetical protein
LTGENLQRSENSGAKGQKHKAEERFNQEKCWHKDCVMSGRKPKVRTLQAGLTVFAVCACDIAPPAPPSVSDKLPIGQRNPRSGDSAGTHGVQNMDPKSWAQKLQFLQETSVKTASGMTDIERQLGQIFAIREALCNRHSDLMNACAVHTPLSPRAWKPAGCKPEKNKWQSRNYSAFLSGVEGKFQLIFDNSIESNIFNTEEPQKITWIARGNRNLRDLKLSDVGSAKIKFVSGEVVDLKQITFKFQLDDDILLTHEDILEQEGTGTTLILKTLPITKRLSAPECIVDENNIDEIVSSALSGAKEPEPFPAPSVNPDLKDDENARNLEFWISDTRRQLEAKGDIYLAAAQDISKLRRDLRGELQLGCWGRDIIRRIEIQIKGDHLAISDWDRSLTSAALGAVGNPTQTTFDFGGGLKFTNTDENTFPLFQERGKWIVEADTDLTIGDLSNIIIQKGGYSYQATQNCWSTWGGLGTACEWHNREADRYKLESLSIKINGQSVYEKDSMNLTFQRNSMSWIEKELTSNSAYTNLMKRRDCPAAFAPRQGEIDRSKLLELPTQSEVLK